MWGKAIVVVLLAVLANFYLGGRTERPSDAAKADRADGPVCTTLLGTTTPRSRTSCWPTVRRSTNRRYLTHVAVLRRCSSLARKVIRRSRGNSSPPERTRT